MADVFLAEDPSRNVRWNNTKGRWENFSGEPVAPPKKKVETPDPIRDMLPIAGGLGAAALASSLGKGLGDKVANLSLSDMMGSIFGQEQAAAAVGEAAKAASIASSAAPAAPELLAARAIETAAPASSGVGGLASSLLPVAGAIGVADLLKNERGGARGLLQGAGSGAALGSWAGPALGAAGPLGIGAGAVLGGLLGFGEKLWGSGKDDAQLARDKYRQALKQSGFIDDQYNLPLATGGAFDIGREKFDDGGRTFEVMDRPNFEGESEIIGAVNPLAYILTGADQEKGLTTALAGQLTNAATQGAQGFDQARDNILSFYNRAGIDRDAAFERLDALRDSGMIDPDTHQKFRVGVDSIFSGTRIPKPPGSILEALISG